ncbi:MAG: hypothetical protein ACRETY_08735 [Steroidobacteraceae bacterium]
MALLPKMGVQTAHIVAAAPASAEFVQFRLYLVALAGLLLYFVVDRYRARAPGGQAVLTFHGLAFAGYNALVGYLLEHLATHRAGYVPYVLLAVVMALHLFAIDHQLRAWHGAAFDRVLRWLMAAAVPAGWLASRLWPISDGALAAWSSLLAGAILINVFNEELPRDNQRSLPAFLSGVVAVVAVAAIFRTVSRGLG